jgi:branched-chain amino acid transport system ATP-binding protein
MNRAIDIIQEEHRALAAVLNALMRFVDGVSTGRYRADFVLLDAMIEYIKELPEKVHHPKEDGFLFARLRARCAEAIPIIEGLEDEHRQGPARMAALEQALSLYRCRGADALAAFQTAVRRYVEQEWRHMATEEGKILPLATRHLDAQDWADIVAAFEANGNPWEGASGEYAQLFSRIVQLAPAPIGVGPGQRQ